MFKKKATFSNNCSVKALNKPTGKGWEELMIGKFEILVYLS